jgi:putative redox protein
MQAQVKWIDGLKFISIGDSGHAIVMDSSTSGEESVAPSPTELLLQALAGCTGMDVISILQKMREPVEGFEIKVEGERAKEHPKVLEHIKLEYIVYGNVNPDNFEKAINLSQEKYCNISITLKRAGAKIDIIKTIKQRN